MQNTITVQTVVAVPIAKVWEYWNKPEHIIGWAFASEDWEAPAAENDLRQGGKFRVRMQSKDGPPRLGEAGKEGFDFEGMYDVVKEHELIEYKMSDPEGEPAASNGAGGRHVKVDFEETPASAEASAGKPDGVKIIETFDPENENPEEVQRGGWQTILDNFKKYVENE